MMCLGWFNQMDCLARPNVEVAPATMTAADAAGIGTCSTPWWFWIVGAGIVLAGATKKK